MTSEDDGVIIGFWLTEEKVIPSGDRVPYRRDARVDHRHHGRRPMVLALTLPPSRIWDHIVLDPKDLRLNDYQAEETAVNAL